MKIHQLKKIIHSTHPQDFQGTNELLNQPPPSRIVVDRRQGKCGCPLEAEENGKNVWKIGNILSEMETSSQYPPMLGASPVVSIQEISRIVTWERNISNGSEPSIRVYL